jgi:hypothetical protein
MFNPGLIVPILAAPNKWMTFAVHSQVSCMIWSNLHLAMLVGHKPPRLPWSIATPFEMPSLLWYSIINVLNDWKSCSISWRNKQLKDLKLMCFVNNTLKEFSWLYIWAPIIFQLWSAANFEQREASILPPHVYYYLFNSLLFSILVFRYIGGYRYTRCWSNKSNPRIVLGMMFDLVSDNSPFSLMVLVLSS